MESPYDAFAWFYDRYWAAPFLDWQLPALERLLLAGLPPGAHILDLCCGTGQLSRHLASIGYRLTGLDSSGEMLDAARAHTPEGKFIQSDASDFTLEEPVDAVISTFDSLNHLLQAELVALTFRSVYAALKPGGRLVFDVNTPGAYGERWNETASDVAPDHAVFLRGGFDPEARIGTTKITMFRLRDAWRRFDVEMQQRPWEIFEIEALLAGAGFIGIRSYRALEDLGMEGHYGLGRVYFAACRE